MNNVVDFSYNWNNKLQCSSFTSIRLANNKYKIGEKYGVRLKGQFKLFFACVVDKKSLKLKDINEFIAHLDTGYSALECQSIIKKMYKNNRAINWETQELELILFKYTDEMVVATPKLFES